MTQDLNRTQLLLRLAQQTGLIDLGRLGPSDHLEAEWVASAAIAEDDLKLLHALADRMVAKHAQDATAAPTATARPFDSEQTQTFHPAEPQGPLETPNARPSTSASFQVIRAHASGGLGRVYLARDSNLGRTVALKEILTEKAVDPSLRGRFLLEAEINGNLEHPGIVPVYGLGTHADGRPFYVMRFVEGESMRDAIMAFHRAHSRSHLQRDAEFRKLLGRFIDICEAIAYAHSRGVLHRDLKPANVMLGRYGETLIIDWGLAKAAGKEEPDMGDAARATGLVPPSGSALDPTQAGSAIGTPAYMSPEQARGDVERMGPGTDIYGLGATLHALLTGKPPVVAANVTDLLDRVRTGRITSPRQVDPRVPRALDAICRKALALDPADRYASAQALADDVERWLADEPVTAYREPLWTSAGRWVRRHRTAATAAAAMIVVAVAALGLALQRERDFSSRLAAAKSVSDQRLELAMDAISDYYQGVNREVLLGYPQFAGLRARLLEKPRQFYEQLLRDDPGSSASDARGRLLLVSGMYNLANIQVTLGQSDAARQRFQQVEALTRAMPNNVKARQLQAYCLNQIALLEPETRRIPKLRAAISLLLALPERELRDGVVAYDLADQYSNLGISLDALGRLPEATEAHTTSIDYRKRALARRPQDPLYLNGLANSRSNLAYVLERTGDIEGAIRELREAIRIRTALVDDETAGSAALAGLAGDHLNLGSVLITVHRPAESVEESTRAIELHQKLVADAPNVPRLRHTLAEAYSNLGVAHNQSGAAGEATTALREATRLWTPLCDAPDAPFEYRMGLARATTNLGTAAIVAHQPAEAIRQFRQANALWRRLVDEQPQNAIARGQFALSLSQLAGTTMGQDDAATVETAREALQEYSKLLDEDHRELEFESGAARTRAYLAVGLTGTRQIAEAVREFGKSVAAYESLIKSHPDRTDLMSDLGGTLNNYAMLLANGPTIERAVPMLRRAIVLQSRAVEASPRMEQYRLYLFNHYTTIASVLHRLRRYDEGGSALVELCQSPLAEDSIYDIATRQIAKWMSLAPPEQFESLAADFTRVLALASANNWPGLDALLKTKTAARLRNRADFRRFVAQHLDRRMPANPFAAD